MEHDVLASPQKRQHSPLIQLITLRRLLVDLPLPVKAVDNEEEVDYDLLEEVDHTELEDVLARLAEDSVHGDLLNAPIVPDTVAILVHVLRKLKARHVYADLVLDGRMQFFHLSIDFLDAFLNFFDHLIPNLLNLF